MTTREQGMDQLAYSSTQGWAVGPLSLEQTPWHSVGQTGTTSAFCLLSPCPPASSSQTHPRNPAGPPHVTHVNRQWSGLVLPPARKVALHSASADPNLPVSPAVTSAPPQTTPDPGQVQKVLITQPYPRGIYVPAARAEWGSAQMLTAATPISVYFLRWIYLP